MWLHSVKFIPSLFLLFMGYTAWGIMTSRHNVIIHMYCLCTNNHHCMVGIVNSVDNYNTTNTTKGDLAGH